MTSNNDPTTSFNAHATMTVDVGAKKSQSLIVIIAITMGILFVMGSVLIFANNPLYWFPFLVGLILLIACLFLAMITHKNTDLAGAHATVIEGGGPAGYRIVTDPRVSLASATLAPILTILNHMQAIPEASGLVDNNLVPIPDTEKEANDIVDTINLEAKEACVDFIEKINSSHIAEPLPEPIIQGEHEEIETLVPQEFTP